jgi:hypothetical protein
VLRPFLWPIRFDGVRTVETSVPQPSAPCILAHCTAHLLEPIYSSFIWLAYAFDMPKDLV